MLKYAFVALSSLFALQFMNADGVIIEDNTPTTLAAGSSQDVTITINKGNVEGFAKLELELPTGLSAESVASSGASFTFAGQKAKFIWMAVPEDEEFSVTYKLTAAESATGNLMIKGVFAYIKDQQRVDYELKNKMVSIGLAGNDIADESEPEIPETTTDQPDPTPTETETASNESTAQDESSEQQDQGDMTLAEYDGDDMQCLRYIIENSPTDYTVKLQVVNNALDGFCKITETMPAGCTAEELDSDGAVVTLEPNGIKYVWFDAPKSETFEVTYRIRRFSAGAVPNVTGAFAFVQGNAPFEQPVMNMGVSQELVADTTTNDATDSHSTDNSTSGSDQNTSNSASDSQSNTASNAGSDTASNSDSQSSDQTSASTGSVTSFPDPEVGITYKVQIAAAHRTVGKSYFVSRHSFNEGFNIENHDGWVKYTTGKHEVYKQARDDRNRIRTEYPTFKGPFVTAYSDGERITVQEALLISNQEWFK